MNKRYYTLYWEQQIVQAVDSSHSMAEAASKLPMNKKTFTFHAKRLGIYAPNPGLKGMKKPNLSIAMQYKLSEILNGVYPQYGSDKLRKRLLKEQIKSHQCEKCKRKTWSKETIPLELHHIDGNSNNHKLKNLLLLCPNCHALTDNYRVKNFQKV